MRKALFLISFYLIFCASMSARQINIDEASLIARQFKGNTSLKASSGKSTELRLAHKEGTTDAAYYYVFNRGTDAGYVIVAGDDRIDEILGYADSGSFDEKNIPENMKWWLSSYADQIKYAIDNNLSANTVSPAIATSVAPLLGSTQWDQGDPYNQKCPTLSNGQKSATGCVATAMAQIMYYHKWPEKGVGTKTYKSGNITLSADFGATTYAWSAMKAKYNQLSTKPSKDAVSTLMFHCGVASSMEYGIQSGTTTDNAIKGLIENFNYDKGIKYLFRDFYSRNEWEQLLKNELDNKRPIMYGGNSKFGGHQFVCDGYDTNGMFHINWGWGGMSDGYFKIAILSPGAQGIGGSTGGFNYNQDAVIGIQKPVEGSTENSVTLVARRITSTETSVPVNTSYTINLYDFTNVGHNNFIGSIGIGYINKITGEADAIQESISNFSLNSGYSTSPIELTGTMPNTLGNGDYKIVVMAKNNGATKWEEVKTLISDYKISMTLSDGIATIISGKSVPILSASNLSAETITSGQTFNVSCDITNTGDEYYSWFKVRIFDSKNVKVYDGQEYIEDLLSGETIKLTFTEKITAAAGEYSMTIIDNTGRNLCDPIKITINEGVPEPILSLEELGFDNPNSVPKDNFALHAKIINTGSEYNNPIIAAIFSYTEGEILEVFYKNTVIPAKSTVEVTISGISALKNGKYGVLLIYQKDQDAYAFTPQEKNPIYFTLVDGAGVEMTGTANEAITVFPNPAEGIVNIKAQGEVSAVRIFDLNGRMLTEQHDTTSIDVSNLSTGTYMIQVVVDGKATITPLIKK